MKTFAVIAALLATLTIAACSPSGNSHAGAEKACKMLADAQSNYDRLLSNGTPRVADSNAKSNLAQVQAMADAASRNSYSDLHSDFDQLLVEAKSDGNEILNVGYAGDLDNARLACIAHGYVVPAS